MSSDTDESLIDYIVVYSEFIQFLQDESWTTLIDSFFEQWETPVVCIEIAEESNLSKGIREFLFTDNFNQMRLTYIEKPIGDEWPSTNL